MHTIISEKLHGIVDYLTVIIFIISPSFFNLNGQGVTLAYILAAVHFLLSISTKFSFGIVKVIPLKLHGVIELIVSIALVALGFSYFFTTENAVFYIGIGFVIFAVWLLSDYSNSDNATDK